MFCPRNFACSRIPLHRRRGALLEILHVLGNLYLAAEGFLAVRGILYFAADWGMLEIWPVLGIMYFAAEVVVEEILPVLGIL